RLFRKYLLLMMTLVGLALLLSGGASLVFSYRTTEAALASLQQEKATGAAARIEQYLRQVAQQLQNAAVTQGAQVDLERQRVEFLRLLRQAPEVTDVALLDAEGRELIAESRLGLSAMQSGRDRSGEPAFQQAQRGQPWFGPVYFRKESEPYMTVALRSRGTRPALTVAELNLKFVWEVVSRIRVGQAGKAYVVDRDGYLVADPDIGLVLRKTRLAHLAHVQATQAGGDPGEPAMQSLNLEGQPVLVSMAPIEAKGWRVFVEQPVSEVYARLNASILLTLCLLLAGLLVSALAAWALARSMVRPIRTLDEGARRIGAGELDQRIEVNTRDELQGLAEQFNRMSGQLRESYAGLEREVEARTAELRQALEQQTATAEILQVIGRSVSDAKPAFEAIARSAKQLFQAHSTVITALAGDELHLLAASSVSPELDAAHAATFPFKLAGSVSGLAAAERKAVFAADVHTDLRLSDAIRQATSIRGARALLAAPMVREDGQVIGFINVSRSEPGPFKPEEVQLAQTFADQAVIAIRNAELLREIREQSHQLEAANRHKSEFLANMSHELRTPLNAVIGFSEVLLERMFGELNDKQADYLQDIHAAGTHLLSLINDILDLSKVEAGRMELDSGDFDVPSAMGNALSLVRERAQRQGVALGLTVGHGVGPMRADERKFKQILLNLLTNAVKFTPTGGRVDLSACLLDGGVLQVAVADTGIGIAAQDQAAVFEAFRQVGHPYTRKQEGTGLGLALARRFVELHGGALSLQSEPGRGSTFTFTLPPAA
ncbi:MAG: ATP-binding protein, partial [Rubrivivax sp.]